MSIRMAGLGFRRPKQVTLYHNKLTATGRFDITGIPPSYDELQIRILRLRTDEATAIDGIHLFFNNDSTAANYRNTWSRIGSTTGGGSQDTINFSDSVAIGICPGASATADYFESGFIILPGYGDDKTKIAYFHMAGRTDALAVETNVGILHWENTNSIDQITLQPDGHATDEFVVDSEIFLIGVKY